MGDHHDLEDELFNDLDGTLSYLDSNISTTSVVESDGEQKVPSSAVNGFRARLDEHEAESTEQQHFQPSPASPSLANSNSQVAENMASLFDNLLRRDAESIQKMPVQKLERPSKSPSAEKGGDPSSWRAVKPGRRSLPPNQLEDNPFTQWMKTGFSSYGTLSNWTQRKDDMNTATSIASHYALPPSYLNACHGAAAVNEVSLTDLMRLCAAIYFAPISDVNKETFLQKLSRGRSPKIT